MNREETREEVLKLRCHKSVLLEFATGYGKSKLGIELGFTNNINNILIVIPRLILIPNWKEEIIKWGHESELNKVTFVTYKSLPKYKDSTWDCIIYDEAHHLSERCREAVRTINSNHNILLSATVNRNLKYEFYDLFSDLFIYTIDTKEAIDNGVLPDPTVYLIPLTLDNTAYKHKIVEHPKAKEKVECFYRDRWKYLRDKNKQVHIKCTEYQYVEYLNTKVEYWKRLYMRNRNEGVKTKWLHLSGERLKFLANIKNPFILTLLDSLKNQRVLTFCSDIQQTIDLGKNCINSKNKESEQVLDKFNKGKIKHITACNMLNEGRHTCPLSI